MDDGMIVTKNAERSTLTSNIIAEIEVREGEELTVTLGSYPTGQKPKGFSLEIAPEVGWSQVITRVSCVTKGEELLYWLFVANQSSDTVSIIVGQVE